MTDFAAIIRAAWVSHPRGDYASADAILTLPVPELCPTCVGNGWIVVGQSMGGPYGEQNQCPDCPTFAKLLTIGAEVWPVWLAKKHHTHEVYHAVERAVRAVKP